MHVLLHNKTRARLSSVSRVSLKNLRPWHSRTTSRSGKFSPTQRRSGNRKQEASERVSTDLADVGRTLRRRFASTEPNIFPIEPGAASDCGKFLRSLPKTIPFASSPALIQGELLVSSQNGFGIVRQAAMVLAGSALSNRCAVYWSVIRVLTHLPRRAPRIAANFRLPPQSATERGTRRKLAKSIPITRPSKAPLTSRPLTS